VVTAPSSDIGPDRHLPFAFVDDLDAPVLTEADHHHLARVRRVRDGEQLTVGDGRGRFRLCRFASTLEADGPVISVPVPSPTLTVGFALTKGDRPEVAVQKLTEVGVDVIAPFVAARTVVRWDDDKTRSRRRLRSRSPIRTVHRCRSRARPCSSDPKAGGPRRKSSRSAPRSDSGRTSSAPRRRRLWPAPSSPRSVVPRAML
jgi:hypothetical protein